MPDALSPWYTVALPPADIRDGRLDESVFAAKSWAVRQNDTPTTYLTGGLGKIRCNSASSSSSSPTTASHSTCTTLR